MAEAGRTPRRDAGTVEREWDAFLDAHSDTILRVARIVAHDDDATMDCYVYVLDRLRENASARIKAYSPEMGCSFSTWLAVVVRRLCVDRYRETYGRRRGNDARARDEHGVRRRLADLVGVEAALEQLPTGADSLGELEQRELSDALESVLANLDQRDRLLLSLRFEDDLSARQVAQIMGFPTLFHVYRRLNAVLGTCREALEQKGLRAPDG